MKAYVKKVVNAKEAVTVYFPLKLEPMLNNEKVSDIGNL